MIQIGAGAGVDLGEATMKAPGAERAMKAVLKWAEREAWRGVCDEIFQAHIEDVCDLLDIDPERLLDEVGPEIYTTLLLSAIEDFLTRRFEPEGISVVDDYLRRRGWKEGGAVKGYLRGLGDSVVSLYEVVEVAPGSHVLARDLLRPGEPIRLEDVSLSENAVLWDRMSLRVVEVNGRNHVTGSVLLFSFEAADALLGVFRTAMKRVQGKGRKTAPQTAGEAPLSANAALQMILESSGRIFTRIWLAFSVESLEEPALKNFDGEDIVLTEIRFAMDGAAEEIRRRLDAAEPLVREADSEANWVWVEPSAAAASDGVMGSLTLAERDVVLDVNSRQRAARGAALIGGILDGLVGTPRITEDTLEQAATELEASPEFEPIPLDEAAATLTESLHRYFGNCLDDPIKILDDRSPRQVARRKAGRNRVADWLKFMENNELHRAGLLGDSPYDFTWMWEELGVAELRQGPPAGLT